MSNLLIVSPHFPPINAPDMQRVRMSLAHFAAFGWRPVVLTVKPEHVDGVQDPLLLETIPSEVLIHRVPALPVGWTRKIGLGNVGLRAMPFLYRSGADLIRKQNIDLVYFSTTMFPTLALGRIWKQRLGVPYVVDMQDPWVSDYRNPHMERTIKYRLMRRVHRVLEPWTMQAVDGLIAVSDDYIETLCRRYPRCANVPSVILPFAATDMDFQVVRARPQPNRFFEPGDGKLHGVYVGRGGVDMAPALRIIFDAFRNGLQEERDIFSHVRLHFVGTSYAPAGQAQKTIEPVATEFGLAEHVHEHPSRVPYSEALQLLLDSDFLIVPGSDDPQYTASKIYPYILARKPLLAVFHAASSVVDVLRTTGAGEIVTFSSGDDAGSIAQSLLPTWAQLLRRLPFEPQTNWQAFEPYTAREMTRRQCELFDAVMAACETTRAHATA